jgi:hypothetical protein
VIIVLYKISAQVLDIPAKLTPDAEPQKLVSGF